MELGTVATPFEHRPIGTELALCQRYFTKTFNLETAVGQNTSEFDGGIASRGNSSGQVHAMFFYKTSMRATPTITTYSVNATNANWNTNDGNTQVADVRYIGQNSSWINGSPATVGSSYVIQASASAEL